MASISINTDDKKINKGQNRTQKSERLRGRRFGQLKQEFLRQFCNRAQRLKNLAPLSSFGSSEERQEFGYKRSESLSQSLTSQQFYDNQQNLQYITKNDSIMTKR